MEPENSRSVGLGTEFEGNGGQKMSASSSHHQINGLQYTTTKHPAADSFVVDMERFEKDNNSNSRITRSLSRKGSVRGAVEKKIPIIPNSTLDNLLATSPRGANLHGGGAGTAEKPTAVAVGTSDHSSPVAIMSGATTCAETKTIGCKRFGFRRPSSPSWILDPRRILLFFATLSSMGTMLLIYLSLSVGNLSAEESALD